MKENGFLAFAEQALSDLRRGDAARLQQWARSQSVDLHDGLPATERLENGLRSAEGLLEALRQARTANDEPRAEVYEKLLGAELTILARARAYSLDEVRAELERQCSPKGGDGP